jgi:hypothetical protein
MAATASETIRDAQLDVLLGVDRILKDADELRQKRDRLLELARDTQRGELSGREGGRPQ